VKVMPAGTTSVTVIALVPVKAAPTLVTARLKLTVEAPPSVCAACVTEPVLAIPTSTTGDFFSTVTVVQPRLFASATSLSSPPGATAAVAQFSYLPGVLVVAVTMSWLRWAPLANVPAPNA